MAVVTQPLGSAEARGSVGGLTFSAWRGKSVVRTRAGPSGPPTAKQLAAQDALATASANWRTLDQATRDIFHNYARQHVRPYWTGEDLRIPGFHWYVKLQCNLYRWEDISNLPDPWPVPAFDMPDANFEQVTNALNFSWTPEDPAPQENAGWEIWIAGPHSAGRFATIHDALFLDFFEYPDDAAQIIAPPDGWYTAFFRPLLFSGQVAPFRSLRAEYAAP